MRFAQKGIGDEREKDCAICCFNAIVSGCGRSSVSTEIVRMPDGKDVVCVWKRHGYAGGLSCDFEGIKK